MAGSDATTTLPTAPVPRGSTVSCRTFPGLSTEPYVPTAATQVAVAVERRTELCFPRKRVRLASTAIDQAFALAPGVTVAKAEEVARASKTAPTEDARTGGWTLSFCRRFPVDSVAPPSRIDQKERTRLDFHASYSASLVRTHAAAQSSVHRACRDEFRRSVEPLLDARILKIDNLLMKNTFRAH